MASQDFAAALESLTTGTLNQENQGVLERHLREEAQGVHDYVEQLRLHALLTWSHGAVAPGISLPAPAPAANRRSYARLWLAGIAALAASLLLYVGITNWPMQDPGASALATITASEDATRFAVGKQLQSGPLTLVAGELQISFASGTLVTLQGPLDAELVNDMTLRVTRGQVTAKLQPGGRQGFTIRTPTADVIDLSTEFGVAVESTGETDVVVFEGSVDVVSKAAAPTTTRLLRGEALSVEATRAMSRLVSIQREAGHKNWTGRRSDQAGIISAVSDNLLDPTNRKCYQIVRAGFADGTTAYVDRDYTWQDVPEILRGADYVMTFNEDKRQPDLSLEVQIAQPTRLYILIDDRSPTPAWLSELGFEDTKTKVTLSETGPKLPRNPFSIWQKHISTPGLMKLGANQAKAMYAVAAVSERREKR